MKAFEMKVRLIALMVMVCCAASVGSQTSQAQSVSPGSLSFGVPTGSTTSAQESVAFSFTGEGSVTVSTVNITGANAGDFTITTDGCSGKTLSSPAACLVGVTFTPSAAAGILENATLNFPFGDPTATVALTGALGAIKLFDPTFVATSNPNATLSNPFTYGSTSLNLSCPADPSPKGLLSSSPDGAGFVLEDNYFTLAVNGTAANTGNNPAGNVCRGGPADNNDGTLLNDCFTTNYQVPAGAGQLNGLDPDSFTNPGNTILTVQGENANNAGGVTPIDISSFLPSGPSKTTLSLLDGGGFVAGATVFLVTNCTPAGVSPGGSITGNPINPNDAGSQTPQFTFDAATGQHIEFDANYLALFGNTEAIQAGTIPTVTETGVSEETFENMVRGTSAGPARCIRAKGLLAADGVTPLCEAFTITCTTPTAQTPAGVNCPHSDARNLLFQTRYDSADKIHIEEGTGPGFLMGSDNWVATGTNCTFTDLFLSGQLCPQSGLTEFKGAGDPVHGIPPKNTNSTFIPVQNMPLPFTKTVVTSENFFGWQNNTTVNVKFSASPAKAPEDEDESNGFRAAPIESVTFGTTKADVPVPDPTFPVPGDIPLFNPVGLGGVSTCPNAPGGVFKTSTSFSLAEGLYKLHFFATDCAETEELKFKPSNDPNVNWASFKTVTVKIDTTKPTINNPVLSTTTPTAGQTVTATYSCSDPLLGDGSKGSGVVRCGTFLFFAQDNTPTLQTKFKAKGTGLQNFTITATDLAGNSITVNLPYTVH